MLYQLDLRLQEIKEMVGVPFGGISLFVFGDMMQLRPVMGRFICEPPISQEFQTVHTIEPRWMSYWKQTIDKVKIIWRPMNAT